MPYDPHHDSIIEDIKDIFARYREMEDRLEFFEHELNALADPDGYGDRKDIAILLEGYHAEFDDDDNTPEKPMIECIECGKEYPYLNENTRSYCSVGCQMKRLDDVKHDRVHKDIGNARAAKTVRSYKHLRQYCVAYQEGGIGCPDCYDFICDACGEHKKGKPEVINTETLCGVVMCRDCYTSRDFDTKCTNDACPVCGGNTPERIEEQTEWLRKVAEDEKKKE